MNKPPKYWNKAKKYLSKKDRVMKTLIEKYKQKTLTTRKDIFFSLCKSIIGQQISVAAANSVFKKFQQACNGKIIPKIVNTTNTTHNRIINVQMFLHEKCNDAMSIQNFARKLMVTMDDMNGDKSESITNVVLKNLQPLSLTERPFHCTNIRKKEWYVKDEIEGWEEDNGEKIIKNTEVAIQKKWIDEFQKKYPNWGIDEKLKDKFVMIATATSSELPEKLKIKLIKELGSATPLTKNEIVNIN